PRRPPTCPLFPYRRSSDLAARLAVALSYLMLGQTESVGLAIFGSEMQSWLAPHAGTHQLSRIIDVLDRLSPAGASDVGLAMRERSEEHTSELQSLAYLVCR